jgi:5-methyltetrahydropteroyltriglutamate--homocysteine methyltransferase
MIIPTEPIGSIPRPKALIDAIRACGSGLDSSLDSFYEEAVRDTIRRFAVTRSPVITDGEQRKYHNYWTYSIEGLPNTAPDGFKIPFAVGSVRRMPRLTAGPFRYASYADRYLDHAMHYARVPLKQAVISPSALSLLYPDAGIADYPRDAFIEDLLHEHVTEVRRCLDKRAYKVQIDFTEGLLALRLDPTGALLASFVDLNNLALARFSDGERQHLGVHICSGGDWHESNGRNVEMADLMPSVFQTNVVSFYIGLAGEPDRMRILQCIRQHLRPHHRVFIGVVSPTLSRTETVEEVRDLILEAAEYIPADQLGTTDDSGFSPFYDDTWSSRDRAFAKIQARIVGTQMASEMLDGRRF